MLHHVTKYCSQNFHMLLPYWKLSTTDEHDFDVGRLAPCGRSWAMSQLHVEGHVFTLAWPHSWDVSSPGLFFGNSGARLKWLEPLEHTMIRFQVVWSGLSPSMLLKMAIYSWYTQKKMVISIVFFGLFAGWKYHSIQKLSPRRGPEEGPTNQRKRPR